MALSWEDIRTRAAAFSRDHAGDTDERAESQTFWNDFFNIFGLSRTSIGVYEHSVERLRGTRGFIDFFWPGELIIEQKSAGKNLFSAREQVLEYCANLNPNEHPKRYLLCDFQRFELYDLRGGDPIRFTLSELKDNIHHFGFVLGRQQRTLSEQAPVSIKAAELIGTLHDEIAASGYTGHKLELFLTRIVFCLFADDTGIFEPRDIMWAMLDRECAPDGSQTAGMLSQFFDILNTPGDARSEHIPNYLAEFPHVNGKLFEEQIAPPYFNASMHAALVNACRFDWTPISPAIFGSLFQSVMDPKERRARGAHYTTEHNIMKVIEPLFLDDLKAELARLLTLRSGRRQRLQAFHDKLSQLTFFDPACGCGNFLIIAYREIRLLEIEVLRALSDGQRTLDLELISKVDVDQFYGIEYEEFPAEIAKVALYMMDHLMNRQMSDEFGEVFRRLPLKHAPTIVHGDALEIDWKDVLEPERCSYVLGNPPFVGFVFRKPEQKEWFDCVLKNCGIKGSRIDYVFGWFLKAAKYAQLGAPRIGLVSTNSVSQGEQVSVVWPTILDELGMSISFAHKTFEWGSEARGKAHVHVVIIGLDRKDYARKEKRLFSYKHLRSQAEETVHSTISPYLIDTSNLQFPNTVIQRATKPLNGLPILRVGTKPVDGGFYIFDRASRDAFLMAEPRAENMFRPFVGAREFLNGIERFILWVSGEPPEKLRAMPSVLKRIQSVREFRANAASDLSKALSETPAQFHVTVRPECAFLAIPEVSSERRQYAPIGFLNPPITPSNQLLIATGVTIDVFALLHSQIHNAWQRSVGGKLKSDYRYAPGLVYNTFPLPKGDLTTLAPYAQAILDARANHPDATLADLYDPDLMPPDLRRAHQANDRAVDRLYRKSGFESDRERVEHLFQLYEQMVKPLLAEKPKRKRRRKAT